MSSQPDDRNALPLDELQIAPEWVRSAAKSYEGHSGEDREGKRGRRDRPPRDREAFGGPPRERRSPGGPPKDRGPYPPPRDRDRRGPPVSQRPPPKPQPPSIAPVEISFLPDDEGLNAMVGTMKQSHRAYALFDIAKLILNKPERHRVRLVRNAAADGSRAPLFLAGGEQPYLGREEAIRAIFRRQKDKAWKETKKPIDPPKGNYTFVNRCGITGEWLGPPNYHEYQPRLVRHHQQRLRHLPFEEFKARIQTVRDPEAVKAWMDSKSFVIEFECLLDEPPQVFSSRRDLETHIIDNHLAQLLTESPEIVIAGPLSRQIEQGGILEAVRLAWETERRFPLKTANQLSERLRKEGFHFFKYNKGITYISHIKLKRFETTEGLGEHVQKLVTFLRANPDSTRKKLLEHFTPPAAVTGEAAPAADTAASSIEEERLLKDLHWLIQDGYVVEFFDGRLWALEDKPTKPPAVVAAPEASAAVATEPSSVQEAAPSTPEQAAEMTTVLVTAVDEGQAGIPAESQPAPVSEAPQVPVAVPPTAQDA